MGYLQVHKPYKGILKSAVEADTCIALSSYGASLGVFKIYVLNWYQIPQDECEEMRQVE